jgi:hypothetical protein
LFLYEISGGYGLVCLNEHEDVQNGIFIATKSAHEIYVFHSHKCAEYGLTCWAAYNLVGIHGRFRVTSSFHLKGRRIHDNGGCRSFSNAGVSVSSQIFISTLCDLFAINSEIPRLLLRSGVETEMLVMKASGTVVFRADSKYSLTSWKCSCIINQSLGAESVLRGLMTDLVQLLMPSIYWIQSFSEFTRACHWFVSSASLVKVKTQPFQNVYS